jgi:hypothetical protein
LLEDAGPVRERARLAYFGDRVPGREPITRDDYEARLRALARVHAATPDSGSEWQRRVQVRRQFDEVADRIQLAAGKREWLLREAAWALRHNAPPDMVDLWGSDVASPSLFARPRPQDFDPDPKRRRVRTRVPDQVRRDPHSVPNMLAALKAAGLDARLNLVGDPSWSRGVIVVKIPMKGRARYVLHGDPDDNGRMVWRDNWDGNYSKAGLTRRRRAEEMACVARMRQVLREGRHTRPSSLVDGASEAAE